MGIEKELLLQRQEKKRAKVGGFLEGKILLDTENPLQNVIEEGNTTNLFSELENKINEIKYSEIPKKLITNKYKDMQKLFDNKRHIARVTIPISLNKWKTNLLEIEINDGLKLEVHLENERKGSLNNFELKISERKEKNKQSKIIFD